MWRLPALLLPLVVSQGVDFTLGGRDWGGVCASGTSQTPIDVPISDTGRTVVAEVDSPQQGFGDVTFSGFEQPFQQLDIGGFLAYPSEGTVSALVDGISFTGDLLQFHVHVPGEHLFDGVRYPLELHLTFAPATNDTGLIGLEIAVPFIEGSPSPFFASVLSQSPLDLSTVLQTLSDYYYYSGSYDAPAPDCLEQDLWVIANTVMQASAEQIGYYRDRYVNDYEYSQGHGYYREVQPLNGRTVYHYTDGGESTSFLA